MRVLISGDLVAVRFVSTKDGVIAYFDVLQHATKDFATEVVKVLCPNIKVAKTLQAKLADLADVKTIMLCNLVVAPKELIVNFVELIDIEGETTHARSDRIDND